MSSLPPSISTTARPSQPPLSTRRPISRRRVTTVSMSMDPLTSLGRLLWGRSIPPGPLVLAARSTWHSTWQLFMRQLAPSDPTTGSFTRLPGRFPTVPDHYYNDKDTQNRTRLLHLYVGLSCPWAHRTLIVRALKNLEPQLPVSVAAPGPDGSWSFYSGPNSNSNISDSDLNPSADRVYGKRSLREVYGMRSGGYEGRVSVPVLWDPIRKEVVCNESFEIIKFLDSGFGDRASGTDLWPVELREEIDEWMRVVYPNVNNGVYRCGFAQSQEAYDTAVNELFSTLDKLESHLSTSRYLCGDTLTLADVCLFTTLIRFDLVYNVLFKCTKKKLQEYPNLHAYTRDIYQLPKVAETCNLEAIMDGYFKTLFPLNPGGIRPVIPFVCEHVSLTKPHNRAALSLTSKRLNMSVS